MAVSTIPERRWDREDEVGIQLPRSLPSAEEAVSSRLGLDEQRAMFGALHPGDYVVHRDHGVALYKGLQARPAPVQLSSGATVERVQEFLVLQFADGVLYIRADQAEKVTRYYVQGVDDAEDSAKKHSSKPLPRLDALSNTQAWQTTRRRVMRSARRAAVDVLRLQALRASAQRPRYRYDPADPAFMAFDRAFEHRADGGLTPDQRKCIGDIFADLCERDMPMDRLICGDVGVGKTEVAMRAMYLAIRNRRQVAFLAPTTALVAQHYRTLRKRMPGEVCVRALSRFTARREARETLQLIADGVCDIVVGTHALLSSRVQFRALCAALTPGEDATAAAVRRQPEGPHQGAAGYVESGLPADSGRHPHAQCHAHSPHALHGAVGHPGDEPDAPAAGRPTAGAHRAAADGQSGRRRAGVCGAAARATPRRSELLRRAAHRRPGGRRRVRAAGDAGRGREGWWWWWW
eukprot:ctg_4204.g516